MRDSDKVMKDFLENGFVNYGGYNQATETVRKGLLMKRSAKSLG